MGESGRKLSSEGVGLSRNVCLTGDWVPVMLTRTCLERRRRLDGNSRRSMFDVILSLSLEILLEEMDMIIKVKIQH